jgi:hypothetical protein
MYLFSRRARLVGGDGMAGIEWAAEICGKVKEVTGQEVQLWATVYSPGFGTVSWTAWFEDLAHLETVRDKLQADAAYLDLATKGAGLTEGGLDDGLVKVLHGTPDPACAIQYVGGVQAVVAGGSIVRAMTAGVEIAQRAEAITGLPTLFVQAMTGPYGSVGWLTGYDDIATVQAAGDKLAADPGWTSLIDSTEGCFAEDAAVTQQTLYRRLA